MAEFTVKTSAVKTTADAEERLRRELEDIQQTVRGISKSLVIKTAGAAGIKRRLGSLAGRVESQRSSMESMKNALERVASLYEETERNICGYTEGKEKSALEKTGRLLGSTIICGLPRVTTVWNQLAGTQNDFINSLGKGVVTKKLSWTDWMKEFFEKIKRMIREWIEKLKQKAEESRYIKDLKARENQVIADINGENYYSNKNMSYAARKGYEGRECTWYAYGRFMEVTGIALKSSMNAKDWLAYNKGDPRVKVIEGGEDVPRPWPAIAVQKHIGDTGHVMIVEGVEYNEDGTPAYVYLTEANNPSKKPDGKLQRLPYEEFKAKKVAGYITKA